MPYKYHFCGNRFVSTNGNWSCCSSSNRSRGQLFGSKTITDQEQDFSQLTCTFPLFFSGEVKLFYSDIESHNSLDGIFISGFVLLKKQISGFVVATFARSNIVKLLTTQKYPMLLSSTLSTYTNEKTEPWEMFLPVILVFEITNTRNEIWNNGYCRWCSSDF